MSHLDLVNHASWMKLVLRIFLLFILKTTKALADMIPYWSLLAHDSLPLNLGAQNAIEGKNMTRFKHENTNTILATALRLSATNNYRWEWNKSVVLLHFSVCLQKWTDETHPPTQQNQRISKQLELFKKKSSQRDSQLSKHEGKSWIKTNQYISVQTTSSCSTAGCKFI
jgi:hypothetical protein